MSLETVTDQPRTDDAEYQRLKILANIGSWVIGVSLAGLFLILQGSQALRDLSLDWGPNYMFAIAIYVVLVFIFLEIISFPLSLWSGFILEHRFGLSKQRLLDWVLDWLKGLLIQMALMLAATEMIYLTMKTFPDFWWALAASVLSLFMIVITQLAPIVLLPIFFKFEPLMDNKLTNRLVGLANQTGTEVRGVWMWHLGNKTRKANAALIGLGRTRRIILSDTLISTYPDNEIEVILAHELGHQINHDIPRGLAIQVPLSFIGFWLLDRALSALSEPLGLDAPSDFASLPLLLLLVALLSVVLLPLANAYSRRQERAADEFALRSTRMTNEFVSAMNRLAKQNRTTHPPHPVIEWIFYTHPSIDRRITFARTWAARHARSC